MRNRLGLLGLIAVCVMAASPISLAVKMNPPPKFPVGTHVYDYYGVEYNSLTGTVVDNVWDHRQKTWIVFAQDDNDPTLIWDAAQGLLVQIPAPLYPVGTHVEEVTGPNAGQTGYVVEIHYLLRTSSNPVEYWRVTVVDDVSGQNWISPEANLQEIP